ncbi:MAG TPA: aminotransferase class I/II-fold pyridoxal phosphate-dependent enzyme [Thermoanaerobaculia bacterium]|nr:aminotransferase class I/II-fold pyridoxal phosphate-dependent enzyme [Thermoanaerobaculia bacterium]
MRLETIAVHAGGKPDPATGSISPPIHLSTTFEHGPAGEIPQGYMYIREGNPTQTRLEEALAAVEGGQAALAFSSGLAAGTAYLQAFSAGTHVIFPDDIYYGFRTIAQEFLPRWGMESTALDMSSLDAVRAAIRPATRLIWAETPSNPLMKVVDLAALAKIANGAGARLIVDGTFATPVLQRPLELGADAVLHATTKYLGGHSDVQGGALAVRKRDELFEQVRHTRHILGAVASPFNSWLVLRGLRSLACRVERHCSNALAIARALEKHASVEAVHYPGLTSHGGHEIAKRQMKTFGGMLSFRVKGGRERTVQVASRVKLFTNATSLGGTESLIEHRASSEGPGSTTPQNLLRVSVGLEHADDLIEDLAQALG